MTARLLLAPGLVAGLLAGTGCSGCGRSPQPEIAPTVESPAPPPPQEAPPRKPMTEMERLLIGTWKLVKRTPPNNPPYEATTEYRADGTFRYRTLNPLRPTVRERTGTYQVQGDLLLRTWAIGQPAPNLLIESVTEGRLVLSGAVEDGPQHVYEYVRVREK